jgi:hypothetical protein
MEESRGAGANILLDRRLVIADRAGGEFRLDQIPYGGPPHNWRAEFASDSPLEQAGFGLSVPRQWRDPLATDNQGEEVRFALDALLEEDGFEASVPGE